MATPLILQVAPPQRVAAGALRLRGRSCEREAVCIRLHDGQGHCGLGEALPLPGYSRHDAAAVEWVLAALARQLAGSGLAVADAPAGPAQLVATLAPHAKLLAAVPEALFAVECALLDLLARRDGVPAAVWLAEGRALQPVAVSLLLPDDPPAAIVEAAVQAARQGFRVLKLKVARSDRSDADEDHLLTALRRAVDAVATGVQLRLDANGGWTPPQAQQRLAVLRHRGLELVEEPVSGPALLGLPPLPVPWAADESLTDAGLARALLALPPQCRPAAMVLKPAQLGLLRCLELAREAAVLGLGLIVTHSLDGDLGHAAARALAAALPQPPWPCGLADHPGLTSPVPRGVMLPPPAVPGLGVAARPG